jgi:hypothetical protein
MIEFVITKNLAPDVYEVRRIRIEDAGGTARDIITVMRRLPTGIRSEKCVVRRFRRCANVYLHAPRQYSLTYCTPRLYGIAYCS